MDESSQPIVLSKHVQQVIESYFDHLDGHPTCNLHAMVIAEVEKPLLETVMKHCGENQTKAAKVLGVSRATLRKKLEHYGRLGG